MQQAFLPLSALLLLTLSHVLLLISDPSRRLIVRPCFDTALRSCVLATHVREQGYTSACNQGHNTDDTRGRCPNKGRLARAHKKESSRPAQLATPHWTSCDQPRPTHACTQSLTLTPQNTPAHMQSRSHPQSIPAHMYNYTKDTLSHTCLMFFLLRCLRSARKSSNVT